MFPLMKCSSIGKKKKVHKKLLLIDNLFTFDKDFWHLIVTNIGGSYNKLVVILVELVESLTSDSINPSDY